MAWIATLLIFVCFGVGKFYKYHPSQKNNIDSPIEQMAESVLRQNGIDYDFSAEKKEAIKKEKEKENKK